MLKSLLRAPKESRVLTVVFLTVLVQVLVLSAFGMKVLRGQSAEGEREARDISRRVLMRNLVEEVDRRVREEEAAATQAIGVLPVESPANDAVLPGVVGGVLRANGLFRRAFLLDRDGAWFGAGGAVLVPAEFPGPARTGGDSVAPFDRAEEDLAGGADPMEVLGRLRLLMAAADPSARPRGLTLLALVAERAGSRAEAVAAWSRLLREHPFAQDDLHHPAVPLGPTAARHRATLLLSMLGDGGATEDEVAGAVLDLRTSLLRNRFQMDEDRQRWERDRLAETAQAAAAVVSPAERDRIAEGIAAADGEEAALVSLRRMFGARLLAVARGQAPGGRLREGVRILHAVPLRGPDGPAGAVVFELDLDGVRTGLLPLLLRGLPLPEGVGATVLDPEGGAVVAEAPAATGPVLAETRLGEALPFWTAVAFLRDPEFLERRTAPARRLQLWIMGLSIAGILCAGWFVTRTVRRELQVANMKSDFLSNVTHELKTPLTSIRMFVETLQEGRVRDDAERKECLDVISREAERLSGLIQRVLDLARFEGRKRAALSRREVDLGELVRETAGIFRRGLADSSAELSVEVGEGLPAARVDPAAIQELILNLLGNAVKYGGRHVRLEAGRRGGNFEISVVDDGIGIDEKDRQRIFEKFYRADDHLARRVEGSGLGLALVREIAKAHGGKVAVASRKGEGSRFTVTLPIEV